MSDESEGEEHYYSGSEEDAESLESASDGVNHGLLDLEASEASSEPDQDGDRSSEDGSYGGSYDGSYARYDFPRFMQLPPEIREMVWAAFCPDLGPEPRVFELHLQTVISPPGAVHLPMVVRAIVAGPQLESQTEPMRAVLAVHQESRALGLKSAPNELPLANGLLVRYHEERDVLFVTWNEEIRLRGIALRFQELGIEARNIAFPPILCHHNQDELVDLMYLLPQARRLFILDEEDDMRDPDGVSPMHIQDYAWTVSNKIYRYHLDTEEEAEFGLSNTVSRIFCWPNLDKFPEFAQQTVTGQEDNWWWNTRIVECRARLRAPLEDSRELSQDDISEEEKAEAIERLQSIEVWPMVRFNFGEGLDLFYYMESHGLDRDRLPPDYLSDSEGFDEEVEDEYESSGIDDDPIDDSTSDEDEDELLGRHLGQDSSHLQGSSSQLLDDTSEIGDLAPANFSSDDEGVPEQDHITLTSDSENDSGSQSRTLRRKRRVVDSDSDESATETEQTPPSRRRPHAAHLLDAEDLGTDSDDESSDSEPVRETSRRARTLPISSEDEDEEGNDNEDDMPQPARSGRRRGRVVPADSEDGDQEDEVAVQQPSGSRKRRGRVVQVDSDDEDEDEDEAGESDPQGGGAKTKVAGSSGEEESIEEESNSSDEEDDDPPPPRRISLAKRLSLESRQAQSRHSRRRDDSEAEEMTGDGDGYSDDQEDEVDGSDNSMVMGMAGEYEGEDGESEEDY